MNEVVVTVKDVEKKLFLKRSEGMEVNFAEIPTILLGIIPEGDYVATLETLQETKTKDGQHDLWRLRWRITEGDHKEARIYDNLVFKEGTCLQRLKLLCEACGLNVEGTVNLTTDLIKEKQVRLSVTVGEYKGKKRNEVAINGYHKLQA